MKKAMVYTITALLSLSALAGCGRMNGVEPMGPTERPAASATPMIVTPDPENGYVRDEDGIITDDDTGRDGADRNGTARPGMNPGATADPGAATAGPKSSAVPKGSGSPSPSPTAAAGNGMGMQ